MVDVGTDPDGARSARPERPTGKRRWHRLPRNLLSIKIAAVQLKVTDCLHHT